MILTCAGDDYLDRTKGGGGGGGSGSRGVGATGRSLSSSTSRAAASSSVGGETLTFAGLTARSQSLAAEQATLEHDLQRANADSTTGAALADDAEAMQNADGEWRSPNPVLLHYCFCFITSGD